MKCLIKPLTKKMLSQLRRGRAIELSGTGRNICDTNDFKGSLAELRNDGFVDVKTIMPDGKEMVSVCLTRAGISFLDKYEKEAQKFRSQYNPN